MTLYLCTECGHVGTDESFHLKHGPLMQVDGTYTPAEYCENTELVKMGATPFDEDEMESIEEFYETRLNQRYEALKKQLETPKAETFEDARRMMEEALKQSVIQFPYPQQQVYGKPISMKPLQPQATYIGSPNPNANAVKTSIDAEMQKLINEHKWEIQRQIYGSGPKKSTYVSGTSNKEEYEKEVRESTEHSEKPKKRKGWLRSKV